MSSLVTNAMRFAIERHGEQKRKYTGYPYWLHLAEVAGLVAAIPGATPEMIAAAWLHDVLEDTDATFDELLTLFGTEVARLVWGLTDVSRPEDGNRAHRKRLDREHVASGCAAIQSIKLADTVSNNASIATSDPAFAKVYLPEKRALIADLVLGDPYLRELASRMVAEAEKTLLM